MDLYEQERGATEIKEIRVWGDVTDLQDAGPDIENAGLAIGGRGECGSGGRRWAGEQDITAGAAVYLPVLIER